MPEMHYVDSTSIEAIGYDEVAQELHVTFVKTGRTYVYFSVERWVFDELMQSNSKGTYVNQHIVDNYDFDGPR